MWFGGVRAPGFDLLRRYAPDSFIISLISTSSHSHTDLIVASSRDICSILIA